MSGNDFVKIACASAPQLYSSTSYTQEKAENFLIDDTGKERACCVLVCTIHPGVVILDINGMQPKKYHSYDEDEWLIPPSCEWTLTDLSDKKYKKCDIKPTELTHKLFKYTGENALYFRDVVTQSGGKRRWVQKTWLKMMRGLYQKLASSYKVKDEDNPFFML
jgi:hypothetical protein